MLSCCKSEPKSNKQLPQPPPKPHYKYSFKQRSHILVHPQQNPYSSLPNKPSSYRQPYSPYSLNPTSSQQSISQQTALKQEHARLERQKEQLDYFMRYNVKDLQREVEWYEGEVIHRQKQIQQLAELLDYVIKNRNTRYVSGGLGVGNNVGRGVGQSYGPVKYG